MHSGTSEPYPFTTTYSASAEQITTTVVGLAVPSAICRLLTILSCFSHSIRRRRRMIGTTFCLWAEETMTELQSSIKSFNRVYELPFMEIIGLGINLCVDGT